MNNVKNNVAISVENLSKSYLIGRDLKGVENYRTFREAVMGSAQYLGRKALDIYQGKEIFQEDNADEFLALRNINFEVSNGERIGIIGGNGAGKSTLLKILSRITEPTNGRIRINGRVASLLEVGTGFHPELTGRENIFLNGAILGMTKKEIRQKFDEIVDFSEVGKFLDTPVKRYSSGMYVRLAFAVAAHLDPEILIVDEVLAVGDVLFQKKCLGKMQDISSKSGKTVFFVSHNMTAISELCDRALLIENGAISIDGDVGDVIAKYLDGGKGSAYIRSNPAKYPAFVNTLKLLDKSRKNVGSIDIGSDAFLELELEIKAPIKHLTVNILIASAGVPLLYSRDSDLDDSLFFSERSPGKYAFSIELPLSMFKEGNYTIDTHIGSLSQNMTDPNNSIAFVINGTGMNSLNKGFRSDRPGYIYWPLNWHIKHED